MVIQARQGRNSATRRCFRPISCLPSACSPPANALIQPTMRNAACCRPDSAARSLLPPAPCRTPALLGKDMFHSCPMLPTFAVRLLRTRTQQLAANLLAVDAAAMLRPRSNAPPSSRCAAPSPPRPPRWRCPGPATPRTLGYRAPTHPSPDVNVSAGACPATPES